MRDLRHKAAVIRVRDELRVMGVRLHDKTVDKIVAAVLRDDTEHDVTRYGRHLESVAVRSHLPEEGDHA